LLITSSLNFMDTNLLKILFYVLCFQLLFVSFFLFQNKKGKTISNKILAIVFLMISISVINIFVILFNVKIKWPQLLFIDDTFMFAYGPLLYLFTQSILFKNYELKKKSLFHFLPFILAICFVIGIILFIDTATISKTADQIKNAQIPIYISIGGILILIHIFYYLWKSKKEIKVVYNNALQTFSNLNQENYKSVNFILNSFIGIFSISLINSILPFMGIKSGMAVTLLLMILFMLYFINSVLFKMLNQSTNDSGLISQDSHIEKIKYSGSSLSEAQLLEYKTTLWHHITVNKRYLDSELNIDDLAKELNLLSKVLSQVINEGYNCNFFDFVNKFRIETAKFIMSNVADEKMTIQEIMYDSGFNSKSSFNTAFKKFTKLTPTQFKESL